MLIEISKSERDTILSWSEGARAKGGRYGDGDVTFPEEAALISLLEKHDGGPLELGFNKLTVVLAWSEDNVDPNFGRGAIFNVQEQDIIKKIKTAHDELSDTQDFTSTEVSNARMATDTSFDKMSYDMTQKRRKGKTLGVIALIFLAIVLVVVIYNRSQTAPAASLNKAEVEKKSYKIEFVSGVVFKKGTGPWTRLSLGDRVVAGDSIKTSGESSVVYADKSSKHRLDENQSTVIK